MPVITISRQFGAGGKTLAQLVANKLRYKLIYEELIEALAERAKVSVEGVKSFESEGLDILSQGAGFFSPKRFIDRVFDVSRKYMDGKTYVRLLSRIIPDLVKVDNAILLGRGAQFILKSHPNSIHVLCIADHKDRIRFMGEQYDLSVADAEMAVNRQRKRRQQLMRLFHQKDYNAPQHYDLVLNLSKLTLDQAAGLVIRLARAQL
jgi:cytidylate kinase